MSLSLDNQFVRLSVEKSLRDLPALPAVVTRVLKETENPDVSAQTVEKLLGSDQALASKVLRVVNSAYYGLGGQVTSLSQAIMILGMPQVRNLVLSVSAISTMKPKTARQQETLKLFWLHAFAAAATTQIIAKEKRMNIQDAEVMFLSGLLHDIGKLFLFCMFSQTYDQVLKYAEEKRISTVEAESRLLGITHGEIGGMMSKAWNLPACLHVLIERHEGPISLDDDPTAFVVHAADRLNEHLYFSTEDPTLKPMDELVLNWLAMDADSLDNLRFKVAQQLEEASALFGLLAA